MMNRRFGRRNERGGNRGLARLTASFTPVALAPYIWIEADSGISKVDNRITAYASKVNGLGYVQGLTANQPLYIAADAGYNNRPIIQIDDTSRVLIASGLNIPFPWSTFEYGAYLGAGLQAASIDNGGSQVVWSYDGGAGNQRISAFDGGTTITPVIADAANVKRSLYRGCAVDKTVTLARNDGTRVVAVNPNVPAATTMTISRVGHAANAQTQKLAAYFIFKRALAAAEVTSLHAWCAMKYG